MHKTIYLCVAAVFSTACAKPISSMGGDPPCAENPSCWQDEARDEFGGYAAVASARVATATECVVSFVDRNDENEAFVGYYLELEASQSSQLFRDESLHVVANGALDLEALSEEHLLGAFRQGVFPSDRTVMTCPESEYQSEDTILLVDILPKQDSYVRSHGDDPYEVPWTEFVGFLIDITEETQAAAISGSYWTAPPPEQALEEEQGL